MSGTQQSRPRLHVFSLGKFGAAAARRFLALNSDAIETPIVDHTLPMPETWPSARLHVLFSWRPAPAICELMEELSYKWRLPFIPVVIDSARLQIGPVIVPGETACWTCWIHRSRQHSPWPDSHASLLQHYATHASEGPAGYLELFAEMAASRVHSIIESLESSASDPGSIWQIDMLTRKILTGRVVGIHDCPRCGNRLAPDTRSYISLQQDLSYLWPSAVTDRG